jgi:predicted nucleic acid-binding protein
MTKNTGSRVPRVYADTSVFGGVFDPEFARPSRLFFAAVEQQRLVLVTSGLVDEELMLAPREVRACFARFQPLAEVVEVSEEALFLRRAYLKAGIVNRKSAADALHVALATANACPVLVSWNCRHIVHFRKIPQYNAVNRLHGYSEVAIHTPLEIVGDENQVF